jgi:hypothetical protein
MFEENPRCQVGENYIHAFIVEGVFKGVLFANLSGNVASKKPFPTWAKLCKDSCKFIKAQAWRALGPMFIPCTWSKIVTFNYCLLKLLEDVGIFFA